MSRTSCVFWAALCIFIRVQQAAIGGSISDSNVTVTAAPGVAGGTTIGIAVNATSFGRAYGMIGGVVVGQDPVGAPPPANLIGPIPPARGPITVVDPAGNTVDAETDKTAVILGFKSFYVHADEITVTKFSFAQAQFVDPLVFSNPSGGAFNVTLTPNFATTEGHAGLELAGSGLPGTDSGSFHKNMSSNLTGFLFSLDLTFVLGQRLGVNLTLGSYLTGMPGWDQVTLTNELESALNANTASNNFILNNFSFPNIPIQVNSGQSLDVFSSDLATAGTIPEPSSWILCGLGVLGILGYTLRSPARLLQMSGEAVLRRNCRFLNGKRHIAG